MILIAFPIYLSTDCAKELDGSREKKIRCHDQDGTIGNVVYEQVMASLFHEEKERHMTNVGGEYGKALSAREA